MVARGRCSVRAVDTVTHVNTVCLHTRCYASLHFVCPAAIAAYSSELIITHSLNQIEVVVAFLALISFFVVVDVFFFFAIDTSTLYKYS